MNVGVELAGEGVVGLIFCAGKMIMERSGCRNSPEWCFERVVGTVNYAETDPTKRAEIDTNAPATDEKIEDRVFKVHNRYNPIPQGAIDNNPNL